MEKSKIPVPKSQGVHNPEKTHISDQSVPCPKKPCPPKPTLPLYSKDPNIVFSASAPDVFKAVGHGRKNIASKKPAPTRGVTNRYRMEAELRDRNQLLEAANISLHANLTNTQDTIKVMTDRQAELENELKELNRRLEKNMIILENRNIDPVSGDEILASVEETSKLRSETKHFTENLLNELQNFSESASEQRTLMQTVMSKWKEADKGRNQFVEEQQAFEKELEQFRECLLQAEKQLDE